MEENIIGGVSPLKRKGMRRGKSYGKGKRGTGDTRYKRDKWVKPTGGGTTVKAPKAPNPKKPYTITPDGKVQMTPPGDVNITEGDNIINQTSGGGYDTKTTTTPDTEDKYEDRTTITTWQQGWDKMKDTDDGKKKNQWGVVFDNLEDFKVAGREYNERTGHTTKKTDRVLVEEGKKGKTTEETTYNAGPGNIANIYDDDKTSVNNSAVTMQGGVGKYKLGGYRAMKENRKK
tara:strand:- start:851 stop:1543 length:693 start_codon:yes stop_codon:yes gene_type:complete